MARGIPISLRLQDEMSPEELAALRHAEFAGINAKPSDLSRANAATATQQQGADNSMDQYIDHVLQMTGMMGSTPVPTARPELNGASAVPVPTARPDVQTATAPETEAGIGNTADIEAADNSGASLGQLAAAALGGSGLALLGRYLMQKYMSGDTSGLPVQSGEAAKTGRVSPIDETIAAIDGEEPKQLEAPRKQLEAPRKQITDQSQQKLLPAPPKQITDQSVTTDASDPTQLTEDEIDDIFRERVEGGDGARPATEPRFSAPSSVDRAAIIQQASELPPREAVAFLQQNGITIDDTLLQDIIQNSNTASAIRSTVRRAIP